MSADSPRRSNIRGVPAVVPPEEVSDRSIIDSVAGFINDVTLANQPIGDPKDTIIWARFETAADISDPRYGDDWELEGNVAPPLLLILGYGLGVQIWAIPANGEAVEVLSWRHGIVSALRILPKPVSGDVSRADEPIDLFSDRRPLMAICDGGPSSQGGSNPQFCSVNFVSLRTGTQVKTIKFKNPVLDILANRTSVVVTFHERIAIFDARTLEDRLTVTTCFLSPGINPNPVALGSRWLAYSENKLLAAKRSGGGCDGDGVASYTATVLNAAKSLGKGLREFTEQVTAGLTGTTGSGTTSKSASFDSCGGDIRQPGIVTILDIKYAIKDMSPTSGTPISVNGTDPIVAHFIAHSEAIVAMEFDNSGMMLLTADKRGHNFHVFRIQPHPVGSTLAAVHHLYVLHRGDTSAKVQNISFSLDTRWAAVSTLRGTTHVFPITPYGGPPTARTHSNLHVVNKLSSFHHSAGLTADGRSSSPISHTDTTNFSQQLMPYFNQTMPPFPRPTVVLPLAQLRQPFTLSNNAPASAAAPKTERGNRQRLSSLSDDNGKPLSVCAVFAKSRSWLLDPPNLTRDGPAHKLQRKAVDSLFVMAGHGALIQYDLDVSYVAKDKKCDDKSIDLDVEAKAQWNVGRRDPNTEIMPPLPSDNWLVKDRMSCALVDSSISDDVEDRSDCWLAQVEIITHAGPSRRLWMGPQFVFKTYNTPSGSSLSHIDSEAVEIGMTASTKTNPERSSPLNMPVSSGNRSSVPVLIESGSYSSIEQSPKLMDRFRHDYLDSDYSLAHGESRLKEDLADAMRESPSVTHKNTGLTPTLTQPTVLTTSQSSSESSQSYHQIIENVVNPLGTVTTVNLLAEAEDPLADNPYVKFSPEDYVIHENCDESLFRPVVVFCDNKKDVKNLDDNGEFTRPPALIENRLIVPVIDKSLHMVLTKKEAKRVEDKFDELSNINKMSKGGITSPATVRQEEEESISVKEEVVASKSKKNKKKVAEPASKELTPPRETKKKAKKEEAVKIPEAEKKVEEKLSECEKKADVKEDKKATKVTEKYNNDDKAISQKEPTTSQDVKTTKKIETIVSKESKSTAPKVPERKKSIDKTFTKTEENKKAKDNVTKAAETKSKEIEKEAEPPKPAERKKSLEPAESKNSKEVVTNPISRKKSLEPEDKKVEETTAKPAERKASLETEKETKSKATKKNLEQEEERKVAPKPLDRKKSLETEPGIEETIEKPVERKKSLEPEPIPEIKVTIKKAKESPPKEVVVTIKKKGKDRKESLPEVEVKQEESDSTSSEETSLPSVKDLTEEEVTLESLATIVTSEYPRKTEKSDSFSEVKKIGGKNQEESTKSPAAAEEKLDITVSGETNKKERKSNVKTEEKTKETSTGGKDNSPSTSDDIQTEKNETEQKKKAETKVSIKESAASKDEAKDLQIKADQSKTSKKKLKANSRSSSPAKEEKVEEPPCFKPKSNSKGQSRETSPDSKEPPQTEIKESSVAKTASGSNGKPKEETSEAKIEETSPQEPVAVSKKKSKSKKQSRESSPDVKELPPIVTPKLEEKKSVEIKTSQVQPDVKTPQKQVESVEVESTKKKNKNKKASRESSPELLKTNDPAEEILPAEVTEIIDEIAIEPKVIEPVVTNKKKNKNKKASRESSPEPKTSRKNSLAGIQLIADDNPPKKLDDSDKEYKVTVKDISPRMKVISPPKKETSPPQKEISPPQKEISPPKDEPKITDFLKFVDHFNKPTTEADDYLYKVTVKDISPPETDHDFPSLSFSTKKAKKNKKPTTDMVLPIEKEPVPIIDTLSPFQPLDKVTPAEEGATLINFESPESTTTKVNILDFERPKGFPKDVIFAICGNLSEPNEVEIEDSPLSSSTASASEETTDETSTTPEKKKKTKKIVSPCNLNDDEELRPLISTTADIIEATPTPEVLYPCKYSEKDAKSSDSSSDTGVGSYVIPETTVVPPQPEQQPTNQQYQNSKKKMKRRKR